MVDSKFKIKAHLLCNSRSIVAEGHNEASGSREWGGAGQYCNLVSLFGNKQHFKLQKFGHQGKKTKHFACLKFSKRPYNPPAKL